MPSNHLILCHPLLILPSIFPSIRVFSNELALQISNNAFIIKAFQLGSSVVYRGLFETPPPTHTHTHCSTQASLSITNSRSLLKSVSIGSVMPSNHLILCRPLLLLPSICPSIRVFSNESVLHIRWPKYWSFSFSISPSNEYSGLISFRMDWFVFLAIQGTQYMSVFLKPFIFHPEKNLVTGEKTSDPLSL